MRAAFVYKYLLEVGESRQELEADRHRLLRARIPPRRPSARLRALRHISRAEALYLIRCAIPISERHRQYLHLQRKTKQVRILYCM